MVRKKRVVLLVEYSDKVSETKDTKLARPTG